MSERRDANPSGVSLVDVDSSEIGKSNINEKYQDFSLLFILEKLFGNTFAIICCSYDLSQSKPILPILSLESFFLYERERLSETRDDTSLI